MSHLRKVYVQVILAIFIGIAFGAIWPQAGTAMKPLGDGFINLIRMMIGPIIFCTIVHGIGSMHDMAKVGRIGLKSILWFEFISTIALLLGLLAAHTLMPGAGLAEHHVAAGGKAIAEYVHRASSDTVLSHVMAIIPTTFVDAFAKGDLLQILLISVLTGVALSQMGKAGTKVTHGIEQIGQVFFRVIGIIVWLAPLGTFGAMAYTIGAFGLRSLVNLGELVGTFYLTSILFVALGLGLIAHFLGFSLWRFLTFIREEIFIVLGTSSSETALPNLMKKLETLGASDAVVGLTVPMGYSFNLCGTNIYMTLGILFLAQATNTHLSLGQEATILLISMLTSKGAAGVSGAGFVTLAATLAIVPEIPIASLGLLLGVDRFMSQCRSITNFIANGVVALAVAEWEGELDKKKLIRMLAAGPGGVEDQLAPAE
ncbi:MAG TPA: C4-dicarboxylate transporter DctA [Rhizomicrobium sp.]|jgi:aerobic C4-dicarboxylate transport protein